MEIPAGAELFETPLVKCWIGTDGILYSIANKADRTPDNLTESFGILHQITEGGKRKYCMFCDISETQLVSKDVRILVTTELMQYTRALAFYSHSVIGIAVGSVFEMMSSAPFPIRTFDDKDEAIKWLRQHL